MGLVDFGEVEPFAVFGELDLAVPLDLGLVSESDDARDGRVSGRYIYRYIVSTTTRKREKPAAVANGLAATVLMVLRYAPKAGPNVNAIYEIYSQGMFVCSGNHYPNDENVKSPLTLKQAPTRAIVEPLSFSLLMSVAIAVAIWTFPSDKPPTILLAKNVLKSVANSQRRTLAMFPPIDISNAFRRPYLSESMPITGDAMAWRAEKRDPIAPPRSTISYRLSMGREKEFL
jgi:hypothetical protein